MSSEKDNKATEQEAKDDLILITPEMYEDMVDASAEAALKKISWFGWGTLGLALICVLILAWVAARPAQPPATYTVDPSGQLTAINAFDKPPASTAALSDLAVRNIIRLFDFNAVNYQRVIEKENRELFIQDKFHRAYIEGIYNAKWFERLRENGQSIRAIPNGMPVVENPKGAYSEALDMQHWLVSVPVSLYIEGAGIRTTELKRTFTLQLVHTRQYQYKAGIGVANIKVDQ